MQRLEKKKGLTRAPETHVGPARSFRSSPTTNPSGTIYKLGMVSGHICDFGGKLVGVWRRPHRDCTFHGLDTAPDHVI